MMANRFFARKTRVGSLVFLWMGIVCICALLFLPVISSMAMQHAPSGGTGAQGLPYGSSGGCGWKFEKINDEIVFTIFPSGGKSEGTLGVASESKGKKGEFPWRSLAEAFKYVKETKKIVVKEGVKAGSSLAYLFSEFKKATEIDLKGLDITGATSMRYMFSGCEALKSLDLSGWGDKTKSVTDMQAMFNWCKALKSVSGISKWNTGAVTNMAWMFSNCHALVLESDPDKPEDLKNWDTKLVEDTYAMFTGCQSLTSLDLSGWDVRAVRQMSSMFAGCTGLEVLKLDSWGWWDQKDVDVYMANMFENTPNLRDLTLGIWFVMKTGKDHGTKLELAGTSMGNYWVWQGPGDKKAEVADSKIVTFHNGLGGQGGQRYIRAAQGYSGRCEWKYTPLEQEGKWVYELVIQPMPPSAIDAIDAIDAFADSGPKRGVLENWDKEGVPPWKADAYKRFYSETVSLKVLGFGTQPSDRVNVKAPTCLGMFSNFTKLEKADVSGLDVSVSTSMEEMFCHCEVLESLDLGGFNVSNVTSMRRMFDSCYALSALSNNPLRGGVGTDLSSWGDPRWSSSTSKVTDMGLMFWGCRSLTSLNLALWDTSNVTDMGGMFKGCSALTSLNLSGWVAKGPTDKKPTNEMEMFSGTEYLRSLALGEGFYINEDAGFEDAGTSAGEYWVELGIRDLDQVVRLFDTSPLTKSHNDAAKFFNTQSGRTKNYERRAITKGVSGTCRWQYVPLKDSAGNAIQVDGKDTYKLEIRPLPNKEMGTLESWEKDKAPWRSDLCEAYYPQTTEVVIEGTIGVLWGRDMFAGFHKLKSINTQNLYTKHSEDMQGMFYQCYALTSLDLSGQWWDVSSMQNAHGVFNGCYNLTEIKGLNKWNTSNVTDMSSMFRDCYALESLDLSKWNTSKVGKGGMANMFSQTKSLKSIILGKDFDFSGDDTKFGDAGSSVGSHWVRTTVGDFRRPSSPENPKNDVFSSAEEFIKFHNKAEGDGAEHYEKYSIDKGVSGGCEWEYTPLNVKDEEGKDTYKLSIRPLSGQSSGTLDDWGKAAKDDKEEIYPPWRYTLCDSYREQTTELEIKAGQDGAKTVKTPTCRDMFNHFEKLKKADVSGLDVSSSTNMVRMFRYCKSLESLNLGGWDTSKVTNMDWMFEQTYSLSDLTLGDKFTFLERKGEAVGPYFQDAGSYVGVGWAPVKPGTVDELGEKSVTADELISSHNKEKKKQRYIRQAIAKKGVSGSCRWEYVPLKDSAGNAIKVNGEDTYKLVIQPLPNIDLGVLENWGENVAPPWRKNSESDGYRKHTTAVEIKAGQEGAKTVKASTCAHMFSFLPMLKKIDTSGLDVSKSTSMQGMFYECHALDFLDVSEWVVSSMQNAQGIFQGCHALTEIKGLGTWNTTQVTNMCHFFDGCKALTSLDLSGWDTSGVTNMAGMFSQTHSLKDIILGDKFQFKGDAAATGFGDAGSWAGDNWVLEVPVGRQSEWTDGPRVPMTPAGLSMVGWSRETFTADELIKSHDGGKKKQHYIRQAITKGVSGSCMWKYVPLKDSAGNAIQVDGKDTYKLVIQPLEGKDSGTLGDWTNWWQVPWSWAPIRWTESFSAPYRMQTTKIEIKKKGSTKSVKALTCHGMFRGFQKVTDVDISGLDTSEVKDMSFMFEGCCALAKIDGLDELNVFKVTSMVKLFYKCHALRSLAGIEKWETSWKLSNAEYMFAECHTLASLDLSGWQASDELKMSGMFSQTRCLEDITLGAGFKFVGDAKATGFDSAGSWAGQRWAPVEAGTVDKPGKAFATADKLINSHNDGKKKQHYVRLAITEGVSGSCRWKYTTLVDEKGNAIQVDGKDTYKLSIQPLPGKDSGVLGDWGETPPWKRSPCDGRHSQTTELEIKGSVEVDGKVKKPVKARTCHNMFAGFKMLKIIDISGLDVSESTDMQGVFSGCESLKSLDLSIWGTSAVTDMSSMFKGCKFLESLNLSGWSTAGLNLNSEESMKDMFSETYSLKDITLAAEFKIGSSAKFEDAGSWVGDRWIRVLKGHTAEDPGGKVYESSGSLINFHNDKKDAAPERYVRRAITRGISGNCRWEYTPLVDEKNNAIQVGGKDTYKLSIQPLPGKDSGVLEDWGTGDPPWRHDSCDEYRKQTTELEIKKLVTQQNGQQVEKSVKALTCHNMFKDFKMLGAAKVSGLDVSGSTDMQSMFSDCGSLESLNLKDWKVSSSATNVKNMFEGCSALTTIGDVSAWDTSKVTDMSSMFEGCGALTSLNLGTWSTSSVAKEENMADMFSETYLLSDIVLGKNFKIKGRARFENAGSHVGSHWVQVGTGTPDNPQGGEVFASAQGLIGFHEEITTDSEHYVRRAITKGVSGGCEWAYQLIKEGATEEENTYKLVIQPLPGKETGELENWGDWWHVPWSWAPSKDDWSKSLSASYRMKTTKIEIKKKGDKQPVKALTCQGMFYDFQKVTDVDISGLDTSEVTDMNYMFEDCHALKSVKNECNVSKVTRMERLFYRCYALTTPNVGGWNVSKVTNMKELFSRCKALTTPNVNGWNVSSVTDMQSLFHVCEALKSLDLSSWQVGAVTNMTSMFDNCSLLTGIGDIGGWDTSKVTTMKFMFWNCGALGSLNLSKGSTSKVTDMEDMFHQTHSLKDITLGKNFKIASNADFASAGSSVGTHWVQVGTGTPDNPQGEVFASAQDLIDFHERIATDSEQYVRRAVAKGVSGDCAWEYTPLMNAEVPVTDADGKATYKLVIQPLSGEGSGKLENWGEGNPPWRHSSCEGYYSQTTELEIKKLATQQNGQQVEKSVKAPTCHNMFKDFKKLEKADVLTLDVSESTDMQGVFSGCESLKSLDLSKWVTSAVMDMSSMFKGCLALTTIGDVKEWKTSNVTNMAGLFKDCRALTKLDLSGWDVSNVGDMNEMFKGCRALTKLDLSGWKTNTSAEPSVVDMQEMFAETFLLTDIILGTGFKFEFAGGLNDPWFFDAGSWAGDRWARVGTGTVDKPEEPFDTAEKLIASHSSKSGTGSERYVRLAITKGVSGTCTWAYTPLKDSAGNAIQVDGKATYKLSIQPLLGKDSGVLGDWGTGSPPWRHDSYGEYRKQTTELEIKKLVTQQNGQQVEKSVKALTCHNMFKDFKMLKEIDISRLDVSESTNMQGVFSGCESLKSLDLSKWATSKVTDMSSMFEGCLALTKLALRDWDVSNVGNMSKMFKGCHALPSLSLSGWKTKTPVKPLMNDMFAQTSCLGYIVLDANFKFTGNAETTGFDGAGSLTGDRWVQDELSVLGEPRTFDADDLIKFHNDEGGSSLGSSEEHYARYSITKGVSGTCTWAYTPLEEKVDGNATYKLSIQPLPGKDSGVLDDWGVIPPWKYLLCEDRHSRTTKLEIKGSVEVDGKKVTKSVKARTCRNMFADFKMLKEIDISGLDVSESTNMQGVFSGCESLKSLDLSIWGTSAVTDMSSMFKGCKLLESLNLSGWSTAGLNSEESMKDMFSQTHSLKDIILGKNFLIKENAKFEDAGSQVDSRWVRVGTGTPSNPKGPVFDTVGDLRAFHGSDGSKDPEQYVRYPVTKGVSGDCMWEYVSLGDSAHKLVIQLQQGKNSGSLGDWSGNPPWRHFLCKNYYEQTTELEIKAGPNGKRIKAGTCDNMFKGFKKLKKIDISGLDVSKSVNMQGVFSGCESLESLDLREWQTSNVTSMREAFKGCTSLNSLDLSGWSTSSVTEEDSMKDMFAGTFSLQGITLGKDFEFRGNAKETGFENAGSCVGDYWIQVKKDAAGNSTDEVLGTNGTANDLMNFQNKRTDAGSVHYVRKATFEGMKGVSGTCSWAYIPLKDSAGNAIQVEGKDTYKLSIQPLPDRESGVLEDWGTGNPPWRHDSCEGYRKQTTELEIKKGKQKNEKPVKALTCRDIFADFPMLKKADVSGLDVSNSKNMQGAFYSCGALGSLDVSEWRTPSMQNARGIFHLCFALTEIKGLNKWETSQVTNMRSLFDNCNALVSLDLSGWDTTNVSTMLNMFYRTHSLKDITLGKNFHIKDDAEFEHAGSNVGTHWAQVAGGTAENPKGQVFASAKELADFHHDGTKGQTDNEQYVRVTPITLTYKPGDPAKLNFDEKNEYVVPKDKGGSEGESIKGFEVPDSVVSGISAGKGVKWTAKRDNAVVSGWSHLGTRLGVEEIKAAAQKDGKLTSTIFEAGLVDVCTITFSTNAPGGLEAIGGLPATITVEKDTDYTLPGLRGTHPDKTFEGIQVGDDATLLQVGAKVRITGNVTITYVLKSKAEQSTQAKVTLMEEGQPDKEVPVNLNTDYTLPGLRGTHSDKTFEGIQVGDDATLLQPGAKVRITGNVTITYVLKSKAAQSTQAKVTLMEEGQPDKEVSVNLNTDYTLPGLRGTHSDKTFEGIQVGDDATLLQPGAKVRITGNVTITYVLKSKAEQSTQAKVTLMEEGQPDKEVSVNLNTDYTLPGLRGTHSDKTFEGIQVGDDATLLQPGAKVRITGNVTITYVLKSKAEQSTQAKVTLMEEGQPDKEVSVNLNTDYTLPGLRGTHSDKTFEGIQVGDDATLLQPGAKVRITGNVTITYVLKSKAEQSTQAKVTLMEEGQPDKEVSVNLNTDYTLPGLRGTHSDKTFEGIQVGDDATLLQPGAKVRITGNVTITYVLKSKAEQSTQAKVTLMEEGQPDKEVSVNLNTDYTLPGLRGTHSDKTFEGIQVGDDATLLQPGAKVRITGNVTITYVLKSKAEQSTQAKVTLMEEGQPDKEVSVNLNTDYTLPGLRGTHSDKTFEGIQVGDDATLLQPGAKVRITGNVTITYVLKSKAEQSTQAKVTLMEEGQPDKEVSVNLNTDYTLPGLRGTHSDKTFEGIQVGDDATLLQPGAKVRITGNVTITYVLKSKAEQSTQAKVTLMEEGQPDKEVSVNLNTDYTLPGLRGTHSDKTFEGIQVGDDATLLQPGAKVRITGNVTITYVLKSKAEQSTQAKVTLMEEGQPDKEVSVNLNTDYTLPGLRGTHSDKTFEGIQVGDDATLLQPGAKVRITGNVTITYVLKSKAEQSTQAKVTLMEEGQPDKEVSVNLNTDYTLPGLRGTHSDKTFEGIQVGDDATLLQPGAKVRITGNVTITYVLKSKAEQSTQAKVTLMEEGQPDKEVSVNLNTDYTLPGLRGTHSDKTFEGIQVGDDATLLQPGAKVRITGNVTITYVLKSKAEQSTQAKVTLMEEGQPDKEVSVNLNTDYTLPGLRGTHSDKTFEGIQVGDDATLLQPGAKVRITGNVTITYVLKSKAEQSTQAKVTLMEEGQPDKEVSVNLNTDYTLPGLRGTHSDKTFEGIQVGDDATLLQPGAKVRITGNVTITYVLKSKAEQSTQAKVTLMEEGQPDKEVSVNLNTDYTLPGLRGTHSDKTFEGIQVGDDATLLQPGAKVRITGNVTITYVLKSKAEQSTQAKVTLMEEGQPDKEVSVNLNTDYTLPGLRGTHSDKTFEGIQVGDDATLLQPGAKVRITGNVTITYVLKSKAEQSTQAKVTLMEEGQPDKEVSVNLNTDYTLPGLRGTHSDKTFEGIQVGDDATLLQPGAKVRITGNVTITYVLKSKAEQSTQAKVTLMEEGQPDKEVSVNLNTDYTLPGLRGTHSDKTFEGIQVGDDATLLQPGAKVRITGNVTITYVLKSKAEQSTQAKVTLMEEGQPDKEVSVNLNTDYTLPGLRGTHSDKTFEGIQVGDDATLLQPGAKVRITGNVTITYVLKSKAEQSTQAKVTLMEEGQPDKEVSVNLNTDYTLPGLRGTHSDKTFEGIQVGDDATLLQPGAKVRITGNVTITYVLKSKAEQSTQAKVTLMEEGQPDKEVSVNLNTDYTLPGLRGTHSDKTFEGIQVGDDATLLQPGAKVRITGNVTITYVLKSKAEQSTQAKVTLMEEGQPDKEVSVNLNTDYTLPGLRGTHSDKTFEGIQVGDDATLLQPGAKVRITGNVTITYVLKSKAEQSTQAKVTLMEEGQPDKEVSVNLNTDYTLPGLRGTHSDKTFEGIQVGDDATLLQPGAKVRITGNVTITYVLKSKAEQSTQAKVTLMEEGQPDKEVSVNLNTDYTLPGLRGTHSDKTFEGIQVGDDATLLQPGAKVRITGNVTITYVLKSKAEQSTQAKVTLMEEGQPDKEVSVNLNTDYTLPGLRGTHSDKTFEGIQVGDDATLLQPGAKVRITGNVTITYVLKSKAEQSTQAKVTLMEEGQPDKEVSVNLNTDYTLPGLRGTHSDKTFEGIQVGDDATLLQPGAKVRITGNVTITYVLKSKAEQSTQAKVTLMEEGQPDKEVSVNLNTDYTLPGLRGTHSDKTFEGIQVGDDATLLQPGAKVRITGNVTITYVLKSKAEQSTQAKVTLMEEGQPDKEVSVNLNTDYTLPGLRGTHSDKTFEGIQVGDDATLLQPGAKVRITGNVTITYVLKSKAEQSTQAKVTLMEEGQPDKEVSVNLNTDYTLPGLRGTHSDKTFEGIQVGDDATLLQPGAKVRITGNVTITYVLKSKAEQSTQAKVTLMEEGQPDKEVSVNLNTDYTLPGLRGTHSDKTFEGIQVGDDATLLQPGAKVRITGNVTITYVLKSKAEQSTQAKVTLMEEGQPDKEVSVNLNTDYTLPGLRGTHSDKTFEGIQVGDDATLLQPGAKVRITGNVTITYVLKSKAEQSTQAKVTLMEEGQPDKEVSVNLNTDYTLPGLRGTHSDKTFEGIQVGDDATLLQPGAKVRITGNVTITYVLKSKAEQSTQAKVTLMEEGQPDKEVSVNLNTDYTLPGLRGTHSDKTFEGIQVGDDATLLQPGAKVRITGNVTITYVLKSKAEQSTQAKVTLMEEGQPDKEVSVNLNTDYTLPGLRGTHSDKTFEGIQVGDDATLLQPGAKVRITGNVTITYVLKSKAEQSTQAKVTLMEEGQPDKEVSVNLNTDYTLPGLRGTHSDKTFEGIQVGDDATLLQPGAKVRITGNVTITYVLKSKAEQSTQAKVTLMEEGQPDKEVSVNLNTDYTLPGLRGTHSDKTFEGIQVGDDATLLQPGAKVRITGNVTITYVLKSKAEQSTQAKVTLMEEGQPDKEVSVNLNTDYTLPGLRGTHSDKTFEGIQVGDDATLLQPGAKVRITGNVTITYVLKSKAEQSTQAKVTLMEEGQPDKEVSVNLNTDYTLPGLRGTHSDKTFEGIQVGDDATLLQPGAKVRITGNVTITYVLKSKAEQSTQAKVTLMEEGQPDKEVSVNLNTDYTLPGLRGTHSDKTFEGIQVGDDATLLQPGAKVRITGNVTITYVLKSKAEQSTQAKVTLMEEGQPDKEVSVNLNTDYTLPGLRGTHSDKTFEGIQVGDDATLLQPGAKVRITGNVTITYVLKSKAEQSTQAKVTLMEEGQPDKEVSVNLNTDYTLPGLRGTHSDKTFEGIQVGDDATLLQPGAKVRITGNVTITYVLKSKAEQSTQAKVTLMEEGQPDKEVSVNLNTDYTLPGLRGTHSDKTFEGIQVGDDATLLQPGAKVRITGNVTITYVLKSKAEQSTQAKVTLMEEGQPDKEVSVNLNTDYTLPGLRGTHSDKTFEGIQVGDDATLLQPGAKVRITGNVTITYVLKSKAEQSTQAKVTLMEEGQPDKEVSVNLNTDYTLPGLRGTHSDKTFEGIQVGDDATLLQPGAKVRITGNVTITYVLKSTTKVIPPVTPPISERITPPKPVTPTRSRGGSASASGSSSGASRSKREASSAPSRDVKAPVQQAPAQQAPAQQAQGWRPSTEGGVQKWYFYGKDGKKLLGQHQLVGGKNGQLNWFYFDEETGEQVRGWKHFEHQKKWCYYSMEDGTMLKGQHELEGGIGGGKHWFYFDEDTGAQIRGWKHIAYQNKLCYYSTADGRMLKGQHELEGGIGGGKHWFYFDEDTGAQIRGWKHIDYQNKWCYYSTADGTMLKGQHELEGGDAGGKHWFYFDEETGAELRNCWKEIPSQNKICYYGSDGAMYKGWCVVDNRRYYFDETTGARR